MAMSQSIIEKGSDEIDENGTFKANTAAKNKVIHFCTFCIPRGKHQPATHFCFDCGPFGRYICGPCEQNHEMFLGDHTIKRITEAKGEPRQTKPMASSISKQAGIQDQPRYESVSKPRSKVSAKRMQNETSPTINRNSSVSSQRISPIQERQDESSHRSIQASQALRHNNPDIAESSDVNRPTKTAERYSELYDNEWTETYEAMTHFKKITLQESEIIGFLLEILEDAYDFCGKKAETLKTKLIAEKKNHEKVALADLKNKKAAAAIKDLQKTFFEKNLKDITKRWGLDPPKPGKVMERYANKAVELTWWMHIQDPPVHMVVSSESKTNFDPNIYRAYRKSGQVPEFFVWPPLRLYAEGGVLIKGVVQYK